MQPIRQYLTMCFYYSFIISMENFETSVAIIREQMLHNDVDNQRYMLYFPS